MTKLYYINLVMLMFVNVKISIESRTCLVWHLKRTPWLTRCLIVVDSWFAPLVKQVNTFNDNFNIIALLRPQLIMILLLITLKLFYPSIYWFGEIKKTLQCTQIAGKFELSKLISKKAAARP